jgi:hypothetical protein
VEGADVGGRLADRGKELLVHLAVCRLDFFFRHLQPGRLKLHAVKPLGELKQRRVALRPHRRDDLPDRRVLLRAAVFDFALQIECARRHDAHGPHPSLIRHCACIAQSGAKMHQIHAPNAGIAQFGAKMHQIHINLPEQVQM